MLETYKFMDCTICQEEEEFLLLVLEDNSGDRYEIKILNRSNIADFINYSLDFDQLVTINYDTNEAFISGKWNSISARLFDFEIEDSYIPRIIISEKIIDGKSASELTLDKDENLKVTIMNLNNASYEIKFYQEESHLIAFFSLTVYNDSSDVCEMKTF